MLAKKEQSLYNMLITGRNWKHLHISLCLSSCLLLCPAQADHPFWNSHNSQFTPDIHRWELVHRWIPGGRFSAFLLILREGWGKQHLLQGNFKFAKLQIQKKPCVSFVIVCINWSKKDSILSHICLNSIGGSRVDYEKSLLVADFNDKNLRKYQATTPVLAKAHAVSAQRTQWYSPSPKSVVLKTCGKRHSQIKVHHESRCCVCVCVSLTCDWMDFLSFF